MKKNLKTVSAIVFSLLILTVCIHAAAADRIRYDYGAAAVRSEYISNSNPGFFTNEDVITLTDPVCPGFEFAGWYLESDFRTQVKTVSKTDGDITLYAKWYEMSYRVTYILTTPGIGLTENDISNPNLTARLAGERVDLSTPRAVTSAYTFDGWYTDPDYTQRIEYIEEYTCSDITLYAHWINARFLIQYDLGDAASSVYRVDINNPSEYEYGTELQLQPALTDDPSYTFEGWYTDEFFTDKMTSIPADATGNMVLYAKWTKAVYDIFYVLTDENLTDADSVQNSNPDTREANESVILTAPVSSDKSYRFVGWYTSPDRAENTGITEIKASHQGSITLYAKWESAVYSITYNYGVVNPVYVSFENNNPEEYRFGDNFTLQPLEIDGFIFNGWCTDEALKNHITEFPSDSWGDIRLFADFTEKTYTIEYIVEDKEVIASQVVNTNETVRTTTQRVAFTNAQTINTAYEFGGWYYDKEFTEEATVIKPYTAQNITVYAKWVRIVSYLPVWGDATLSNQLSAADARLILRYSAGLETFNETQIRISDINNDSRVTASDARLALRLSAGLENEAELIERYSLPTIELVDGEVTFKS